MSETFEDTKKAFIYGYEFGQMDRDLGKIDPELAWYRHTKSMEAISLESHSIKQWSVDPAKFTEIKEAVRKV